MQIAYTDELLYVVEFDKMSWISSFAPGLASGGKISVWTLEGISLDEHRKSIKSSGIVDPLQQYVKNR